MQEERFMLVLNQQIVKNGRFFYFFYFVFKICKATNLFQWETINTAINCAMMAIVAIKMQFALVARLQDTTPVFVGWVSMVRV